MVDGGFKVFHSATSIRTYYGARVARIDEGRANGELVRRDLSLTLSGILIPAA